MTISIKISDNLDFVSDYSKIQFAADAISKNDNKWSGSCKRREVK